MSWVQVALSPWGCSLALVLATRDPHRYIWTLNWKPFGSGQWFIEKQVAMSAFFNGEYLDAFLQIIFCLFAVFALCYLLCCVNGHFDLRRVLEASGILTGLRRT